MSKDVLEKMIDVISRRRRKDILEKSSRDLEREKIMQDAHYDAQRCKNKIDVEGTTKRRYFIAAIFTIIISLTVIDRRHFLFSPFHHFIYQLYRNPAPQFPSRDSLVIIYRHDFRQPRSLLFAKYMPSQHEMMILMIIFFTDIDGAECYKVIASRHTPAFLMASTRATA